MNLNTAKHKNWLLLALLIFVGQVVAAPFSSCQMKMDASQSSMQMMQEDMSGMDMSMHAGQKMPCCGDKCDCVQGICMSAALLSTLSFDVQFPQIERPYISFQPLQIKQASSAIFHPPILS